MAISAPSASRAALMLALAHHTDRLIEAGELSSYTEAAQCLELSGGRLAQLMNLLLLGPDIPARLAVDGLAVQEHSLCRVVSEADWGAHVDVLAGMSGGAGS